METVSEQRAVGLSDSVALLRWPVELLQFKPLHWGFFSVYTLSGKQQGNKEIMKTSILLLFLLLLLCTSVPCVADDADTATGNVLVKYCNDTNAQQNNANWRICAYMVDAVTEAIGSVAWTEYLVDHQPIKKEAWDQGVHAFLKYCAPENPSIQQEALMVTKYLHEHPENLNHNVSWVVMAAYQEMWTCTNS